MSSGGSETLAEAGSGIEGIDGGASLVRSERVVSTSSDFDTIMGRGSRPILARWRSTTAMLPAVIFSSVNSVGGTGCQEEGEGTM